MSTLIALSGAHIAVGYSLVVDTVTKVPPCAKPPLGLYQQRLVGGLLFMCGWSGVSLGLLYHDAAHGTLDTVLATALRILALAVLACCVLRHGLPGWSAFLRRHLINLNRPGLTSTVCALGAIGAGNVLYQL